MPGFISRMVGGAEARSTKPVSFQDVYGKGLDLLGGGSTTQAGINVTNEQALQVSTVFACVRILSDNVATLPLDTMRRIGGVPRPVRPRPEFLEFFHPRSMSRAEVLGQMMTSLLLDGNAYVATVRAPDASIEWLEVLDPAKVEPVRMSDGQYIYKVSMEDGQTRQFSELDIKHVRGMMLPGHITGVSPIEYARESIGLSSAATQFGGAFFGNGAIPGSTIEVPGPLSEVAARTIKDTWEQAHRGVGNSNKIAVLTEGASYSKVTLSPDEAQFLQTRQFQVPDIARFYGVPLHLLAQEGPQFGNTTSEQGMAFVQHSLRPWVERVENALTEMWISQDPELFRRGAFVRLNVDGLQRGNLGERMVAYSTAVTQGVFTINEVRRWEGMPPVEWGDEPISVQVQDEPEAESEEEQDEEPTDEPEEAKTDD